MFLIDEFFFQNIGNLCINSTEVFSCFLVTLFTVGVWSNLTLW